MGLTSKQQAQLHLIQPCYPTDANKLPPFLPVPWLLEWGLRLEGRFKLLRLVCPMKVKVRWHPLHYNVKDTKF